MSVQPPSYDKSQEAAGQSLFCIIKLIQSIISGGAYPSLPDQGVNPGYQGSQGMGNIGHHNQGNVGPNLPPVQGGQYVSGEE